MGRQNDGDSAIYNSSIALLQERFRELQRVRERRQEKELLKLISESHRSVSSQPDQMILHNNSSPSSSSSSSSFSSPSSAQDSSFSLGLNSLSRKSEFRARKGSSSLRPNTAGSSSLREYENADVDTSLHL